MSGHDMQGLLLRERGDFERPSAFLMRNIRLLPPGRALDIAMGGGRNAIYLAGKGFSVDGIDISADRVAEAVKKARSRGLSLNGLVADLEAGYRIAPETYDAIICFHYLQRSLFASIRDGLKPGGVLLYETFTIDQPRFGKPTNPAFLLRHGELREAFKDLECLRYWEGIVGHRKAVARFIGRKRYGSAARPM